MMKERVFGSLMDFVLESADGTIISAVMREHS